MEGWQGVKPLGSPEADIWFIAKCPHHKDLKNKLAFQAYGYELNGMCRDASLVYAKTYRTYLVNHAPSFDRFNLMTCKRKDLKPYDLSEREQEILRIGKADFLHPDLLPEVNELLRLARQHKPKLIIGLGTEVAQWLTKHSGIESIRGYVDECRQIPGQKVICTYTPEGVIANYANRPVGVADLIKAKREAEFPEIRQKNRKIYIPETVEDVAWFLQKVEPGVEINLDIETFPSIRLIRCIGVAFDDDEGMCIPIVDLAKPEGSYWNNRDEVVIWKLIKALCALPNPKTGQNFAYDIDWLYRELGIKMMNYTCDTLIMHHAMYPEMKKSLGFMVSLYMDEMAWKDMISHDPAAKKDG